ncbi:MAG: hypothetical protein C0627_08705, partial [Sulfurimonas sp.]
KMIKSLKDLLDKFSRFTNSLVYDGGICKRLNKYTYLTKHINWVYEQEYRMTVIFDKSDNKDKYNINFPTELIKAVYIGVKTKKEDIAYILKLRQKKEWEHLSIYRFEIDWQEYKLKKVIYK